LAAIMGSRSPRREGEAAVIEPLDELAAELGQALKDRKETVAVAESSSGGLISAALLSVPGASAYFLGGAVVYTGKARMALMDLPREAVAGMRSSSEPYALLLARTARERFGATWGISETGAAGPTGNGYGDAAGHSCIAISGPVETAITLETGESDRQANMVAFAAAALDLLKRATI
jgi:nicotinamide-nucleotide amidase